MTRQARQRRKAGASSPEWAGGSRSPRLRRHGEAVAATSPPKPRTIHLCRLSERLDQLWAGRDAPKPCRKVLVRLLERWATVTGPAEASVCLGNSRWAGPCGPAHRNGGVVQEKALWS